MPLVEANHNLIELGPRETGKTYIFRNSSYYSHVLSGGKATPAGLFINFNNGQVGLVGTRDAVVFDEIANTDYVAMTGEITIMGKVLAVGGIQATLLAAIEAGVKCVVVPAENEPDVANLPDYMRDRLEVVYVSDIQKVLATALTA